VLIALPEASRVPRVLTILDGAFPGIRLWSDGVGLVWRGEDEAFRPHRVPGIEVWSFLEEGHGRLNPVEPFEKSETPATAVVETDPLPQILRGIIQGFLWAGKTEATSAEIFAALPASEQARRTDEQVGMALSGLGLKHRRVRVNGARPRGYELSTPWTSDGPSPRTSDPEGPKGDQRRPGRWSSDSTSENN